MTYVVSNVWHTFLQQVLGAFTANGRLPATAGRYQAHLARSHHFGIPSNFERVQQLLKLAIAS